MARPRSCGGKATMRIAALMLNIMAPPTACRTRKSTSWARVAARPQASEARVNSDRPARKRKARPVRSDRRPKKSSSPVMVTR